MGEPATKVSAPARALAAMFPAFTPPSTSSMIARPVSSIFLRASRNFSRVWGMNFGGQKFIPHTLEKLRDARRKIDETGRAIMLEVDGGVNAGNIAASARAGADTFVAGSPIFGSERYRATLAQMRDALAAVTA